MAGKKQPVLTKHSEDQVIPAVKNRFTFEEQMALFDKQIALGKNPQPDTMLAAMHAQKQSQQPHAYDGPLLVLFDKEVGEGLTSGDE